MMNVRNCLRGVKMSRKFSYTYIILQIIGFMTSAIFIGIGTDYVKAGVYKEWLFLVGCLLNFLPFLFAWCWFLIAGVKDYIKLDKRNRDK